MRNRNFTSTLLAGTALFATFGTASAASAQEAVDQEAVDDASSYGEIIVTAQKREQSIQEVPIAVTALGQDALQANRVSTVSDLTGLAPGLLSRTNAGSSGSPSFSMRGVFATASVPSQDRQVSMYIDGVYIGGNRGSVFDLPDLQRIEVLRGPQGTLFGRNATAGAINIVTRDPTGEYELRQDITVGNHDQLKTRTTVDLPEFGPFTAFVTYVHDEKRGDIRNTGAGTAFDRTNPFNDIGITRSPTYLGNKNNESIFAVLKYDNGGDVTATYKFDWNDGTNTPEMRATNIINPNDFLGQMLLGVMAAQPADGGRYGPTTVLDSNQRPGEYNNAWSQAGWQRGMGHNLTLDWQATDDLSFKNITAYRQARVYAPSTVAGLDGLEMTAGAITPYATFAGISALAGQGVDVTDPANAALVGATIQNIAQQLVPTIGSYFSSYGGNNYGRNWQVSNELQANYNSDFVTVTAGLLYYRSHELSSGLPGFRPNTAFTVVPVNILPLGNVQNLTNDTTSLAAYAQAEFDLTPELNLVLGGRLTQDKKTGDVEQGGTLEGTREDGQIVGTVHNPYKFKKTKPTYSIGLNYQPNRDLLVYGKYSTAFLSGGAVADLEFAPETVKSAELGVKSDWFDRMVRFNLTGWWAEYSNAQAANSGTCCGRPDLSVIVLSNGTLEAKGVEAELTVSPLDGLSLAGSVGYTDTKLKNPDPLLSQGREVASTNIPEFAGTASITYVTQPLFDDATMLFRVDTRFQSKARILPDVNVETRIPEFAPYEFLEDRAIFNGRIALRDLDIGGANTEIGLWGKNLFNNKDALYTFAFGDSLVNSSYEPARSYGVDLIFRFQP